MIFSEQVPDFRQLRAWFIRRVFQFAGTAIPVPAVALVALHLVEDGVNPGRVGIVLVCLHNTMSRIPFTGQRQVNRFHELLRHNNS
jgi:hypothetical protein